ncbi:MAG: hypothetical protein NUV55_00340 [Sulfuricaulis sp.]|uniref:hypothetical protein n=1 Tax=Sulfuricaulis sp. TaxID=2003553 RepID=UPI0025E95784|nr:hypothetical protein [Sulfuricaulis sp.]MCR4345645.1 hypothetical protein [Sulfuricaulis sp.]
MRYMQELIARMVDVPLARMFILAAILFLLLAVLGRIEGKIEPGNVGRIGATLLGVILMFVGLAMHFNETDALRDKVRESMGSSQSSPVHLPANTSGEVTASLAMASQSSVVMTDKARVGEKAENTKSLIKVVTGAFGINCGAKPGNATAQVSRACDGQTQCEHKIDPAGLEDSPPDCAKNFTAEWKCGAGATVYAVSMPAGAARGEPLRLACSAQ